MTQSGIKNLLMAFLMLTFTAAFSQEKLPLKEVLSQIEKQHNINFNFTEEAISGFTVTVPDSKLPLMDKLEQIRDEAPVGFEIIDGYVVVTRNLDSLPESQPMMTFDLNEVVIENFLTSGISKKKYGNIVIKPQKMGILPGLIEPDVLQTMQQVPGIYSADESISNLNVRGGTHDQNLFLWNGIRMFQTGHFFGLISAFNPALSNTITLSKNGSPAFFGESVSSVVDISTRSRNIEKTSFGVGANLISADFFAKVKASEKASFVVSARRSHTDQWDSPTYKTYYNRAFQNTIVTNLESNQAVDYQTDENFHFYDATFQYRQQIGSKHEFFIDGIGIKNELGIRQNATIENTFSSKNSTLEQKSLGGNFNWKTQWNSQNMTILNVYVSSYRLDAINQSVENNQVLQQENNVLDTGIRIENHHRISKLWNFNNGYQYNETGITNTDAINMPQLRRKIKEVMRSHAIILEMEYASPDREIVFKGGLRNNYFEQLGEFIVEPRLQFNYTLSKTLEVEILGERKSQTVSQIVDLQRDFLGIEKRRWALAGDDVPIQKSSQFSFGLVFKNAGWTVTLDNFYKQVTGISTPGQGFQNQLELIKLNGNYTVAGSELLVQRNFDHFYTWLSYSFNRNEYEFSNFDPSQFPNNFEIQHSISSAIIYEKKQLKLALGGKWNSGRPTTTPASFTNYTITYNDPNDKHLDDYLQINLSGAYHWDLGKTRLQAAASVLNLFNTKNVINRYYRVNTLANDIERVNTYATERTPNLSLRLTF